jgi:dihydroorotate dehydrogenase
VIERLGLAALRLLDPEVAHGLALRALRAGMAPSPGRLTSPRLGIRLFGRDLPNPVGVAAGFDKNAVAIDATLRAGFGFIEVGGVTPRPQPGNPRPRLFRLPEDRAVINRFGFNNDGLEAIRARLAARREAGVVGVNMGANKDSADRAADYVTLVRGLRDVADFLTVNVSSPNTPGLRGLQDRAALDALLAACREAAAGAPLVLKIAPELDDAALEDVAALAEAHGLAAVIATNTTLSREGLHGPHAAEAGGLSGRPLFARSTAVLARLARLTDGRIPLIGVGGVESAETAYAKIRAGATAVQLYTGLVYGGVTLGARIAQGLDALLQRDGFASVAEAVGVDAPSGT